MWTATVSGERNSTHKMGERKKKESETGGAQPGPTKFRLLLQAETERRTWTVKESFDRRKKKKGFRT